MRTSRVEDAELAALAQAGDREAFGELVARHAAQVRRVCRAILKDPADADDAAQDGLLAALRNLGRYDSARPFGPWLMRIVTNAAIDRRRRLGVRRAAALPAGLASEAAGPARDAERAALREALLSALDQLPERQRLAVVLFDAEGYTHREIAEILRLPVGTVRSDVFHARRTLREAMAPWQGLQEEAQ